MFKRKAFKVFAAAILALSFTFVALRFSIAEVGPSVQITDAKKRLSRNFSPRKIIRI